MPETETEPTAFTVVVDGEHIYLYNKNREVVADLDPVQATALASHLTAMSWGTGPQPVPTPADFQEEMQRVIQVFASLTAQVVLTKATAETRGLVAEGLGIVQGLHASLERARKARRAWPALPPTFQVFGRREKKAEWFALTEPTPILGEGEQYVSVKLPGTFESIGVEYEPGLAAEMQGLLTEEETTAVVDVEGACRALRQADSDQELCEAISDSLAAVADLQGALTDRVKDMLFPEEDDEEEEDGDEDEGEGDDGEGAEEEEASGELAPNETVEPETGDIIRRRDEGGDPPPAK